MTSQGAWLASKTGTPYKLRDGTEEEHPVFVVQHDPVWFKTKYVSAFRMDNDIVAIDDIPPPTEEEYAAQCAHHDALLDAENKGRAGRRKAMKEALKPLPKKADKFAADADEPDGEVGDLSKVAVRIPDDKPPAPKRGGLLSRRGKGKK